MDPFLFIAKIVGLALVLYFSLCCVAEYWFKNLKESEKRLVLEQKRNYPTQEQAINHAWCQDTSTEEKKKDILRKAIETRDYELKVAANSHKFWSNFAFIVGLYGFSMCLLFFYLVEEITEAEARKMALPLSLKGAAMTC